MVDTVLLALIAALLVIVALLQFATAYWMDHWNDEARVFRAAARDHLAKIEQNTRTAADAVEADRMAELRRRFD